jgi:UV excision repair protein RAD23
MTELASTEPELVRQFKNDPLGFLSSFGLDPRQFDLSRFISRSPFEELLGNFSSQEKEIIRRIEKLGFDSMIILQVFEACGRDEELTKQCLEEMK